MKTVDRIVSAFDTAARPDPERMRTVRDYRRLAILTWMWRKGCISEAEYLNAFTVEAMRQYYRVTGKLPKPLDFLKESA